jgi:hypothetical protein
MRRNKSSSRMHLGVEVKIPVAMSGLYTGSKSYLRPAGSGLCLANRFTPVPALITTDSTEYIATRFLLSLGFPLASLLMSGTTVGVLSNRGITRIFFRIEIRMRCRALPSKKRSSPMSKVP